MIMISDSKETELKAILEYYVREVNKYRLQCNYNIANDFLDMLLGALSVYNAVVTIPLEVAEHNNEIELIDKYLRK